MHHLPDTLTNAVVRFTAPGLHHWPGASSERAYLAQPHRHLFYVEVQLEVHHDEREVEFHDLLDVAREAFGAGDFGARSCETLAREVLAQITRRYGGRRVQVSVFEDNEVGAVITCALSSTRSRIRSWSRTPRHPHTRRCRR